MIFFEKLKQNLCKILWEKQIGLSRLIAVVANTLCNAQEKWKTKVMLNFGGQTKCIMEHLQMANSTTRPQTSFPGLFPSFRHFLREKLSGRVSLKAVLYESYQISQTLQEDVKSFVQMPWQGKLYFPGDSSRSFWVGVPYRDLGTAQFMPVLV